MTTDHETFEHRWRRHFEWRAQTYDDTAVIHGGSARQEDRRFRLVMRLLATLPLHSSARVLDLGCGVGSYVRHSVIRQCSVVGLDYSLPSLVRAKAADPAGCYLSAEAYRLPFAADTFHLILCIGVFYVLGHPEVALDEIARVLRSNGVLVVQALNPQSAKLRLAQLLHRARSQKLSIRAYAPEQVIAWLHARDFAVMSQKAVHVPSFAGHPDVARSRLIRSLAHEFVFVAQKRAEGRLRPSAGRAGAGPCAHTSGPSPREFTRDPTGG